MRDFLSKFESPNPSVGARHASPEIGSGMPDPYRHYYALNLTNPSDKPG